MKSRLYANYFSLSTFQIANFALPLVTIPFIVRVLGPSNYGLVAYAQSLVGLVVVITNYSFDLTATREISLNRDNVSVVSRIFWITICAKIFLFLICGLVCFPIIFMVPDFRKEHLLFTISFLVVLGYVVFPTWLLQGTERLNRIALFNFLARLVTTLSVFVFLKRESDYIVLALIYTVGQLLIGGSAIVYSVKVYGLERYVPRISDITGKLREGWPLFGSQLAVNLYTSSNVLILGFFASSERVGYFSATVKIIGAVQSVFLTPLGQTMFPHIGQKIHEDRSEGIRQLKKVSTLGAGFSFFLCCFLFLFSDEIVSIVLGPRFFPAARILKLLSFVIFIISLSNFAGILGMLNLKLDKAFMKVTVIGCFINLLSNFVLSPHLFEIGTGIAWLVTEVFISVSCLAVLRMNKINLFDLSVLKLSKALPQ